MTPEILSFPNEHGATVRIEVTPDGGDIVYSIVGPDSSTTGRLTRLEAGHLASMIREALAERGGGVPGGGS